MIDLGLSKMALIGVVALIVIGPEKLPRVARTVGTLLGKAQRYVNDVKAEVNRSMELDELRKVKDSVETAARDVEQSVRSGAAEFEQEWSAAVGEASSALAEPPPAYPEYRHPRKKWRLNHSPLYLDFLEGRIDFACTAWAIPSYSLKGWQRPCYLMEDGWVPTYKELIETTDWDAYGRGKDERCANCMAHCGYEPTAVIATMGSLRQTVRAAVGA